MKLGRRNRHHGVSLGYRVGSCLENGFGDEGILARSIAAGLTCALVALGCVFWLVYGPVAGVTWLKRKVFGPRNTSPSSN